MKVKNMISSKGNTVANQFIIEIEEWTYVDENHTCISYSNVDVFQSYDLIIAVRTGNVVYLDKRYWNYSNTTGKYRNQFLGETKKETQTKIDSGEYKLVNLN